MQDEHWIEKRKYPRASTQKTVRYRIIHGQDPNRASSELRGFVVSISGGGLGLGIKELESEGLHISFNEDVPEQNWLAIEVQLLPGHSPIQAMAQVAWYQRTTGHSEYNFDVGVEFKDIREEDRQTITDFVNRSLDES